MNNEDFNFCKSFINEDIFNQYTRLKDYENKVLTNLNKLEKKNYIDLIFLQNVLKLLDFISDEKNTLRSNKKTLLYNILIYKLRLLFNISNKDKNLEDSFSIQKEINDVEYNCLNKFQKVLKESININNYFVLSETFLYFSTLLSIKLNVDNYCKQCLTINDCNSLNINAIIYNDFDIISTRVNINKVKNLIFSLNKNNQE